MTILYRFSPEGVVMGYVVEFGVVSTIITVVSSLMWVAFALNWAFILVSRALVGDISLVLNNNFIAVISTLRDFSSGKFFTWCIFPFLPAW